MYLCLLSLCSVSSPFLLNVSREDIIASRRSFQFWRVLTAFPQLEEAGSPDISPFWRRMTAGMQLGNSTLGCRHKPLPALLLLFALAERHWLPNEQRLNHKSVGRDVKVKCGFFTLSMYLSTCLEKTEYRSYAFINQLTETRFSDTVAKAAQDRAQCYHWYISAPLSFREASVWGNVSPHY